MIVCGYSAYSRILDFARFRKIADKVGAYFTADIAHIAGLVAAGEHPNPVPLPTSLLRRRTKHCAARAAA